MYPNGTEDFMNLSSATFETQDRSITYKEFITYKIGTIIIKYWFPITGPLGLIGNILSFIIMRLQSNRKLITSFYLTVLAVNDSLVIIFINSYIWHHDYFELHWEDLECGVYIYFASALTQAGALLLLLMTYDKYYIIKNPLKTNSYNNIKRVKILTCVIYLGTFSINGFAFVTVHAEGLSCEAAVSTEWYILVYLFLVLLAGKYFSFFKLIQFMVLLIFLKKMLSLR